MFKAIFLNPGFIFNTGYVFTTLSLVSFIGLIPVAIMSANWVIGTALIIYNYVKTQRESAPQTSFAQFFKRQNAVLAINGICLSLTGLAALYLGLRYAFAMPGALDLWNNFFETTAFFTFVFGVGFGVSNLKKADEMDGRKTWLFEIIPGLKNVKSEYVVAISGLALCLMTGGWSLLVAIPLFYAIKLGENKSTDPQSRTYKFTAKLSRARFLPRYWQKAYATEHPLTLSRRIDYETIFFSVIVGVIGIATNSYYSDALVLTMHDFATLGNAFIALGAYMLYCFTHAEHGEFLKNQ